jgi:hypothetical protein
MKQYKLRVIGYNTSYTTIIRADKCTSHTHGYYEFYIKDEIIASYPINLTIIENIS